MEEGLSVNSYREHKGSFLVNYQKTSEWARCNIKWVEFTFILFLVESVCSNHRELHGIVTNVSIYNIFVESLTSFST